jgi:APA family basic amino acid/polyamine antiporter
MDADSSPRRINLFTATCVVVANIIGVGVFTSLGFQVTSITSGFALLALWVVGGIFALCGALCYGELASVMPRSGGEYHYLSKIYHPIVGFLSGWVSVTVGFAAPIAAAAIALGKYFGNVVPNIEAKLIALIVVIAISLIHTHNIKITSYFQSISTILKVALILVLIGCGFLIQQPQDLSFLPSTKSWTDIFSSSFATSLVFVTYAYSGWNASIYIADDIKRPERNIPASLLLGTLVVIALYVLLNFVFLFTTPISELSGQVDVGYVAANRIFGKVGRNIMSLLISFGLISSISSMVWAGPRVTQAIGEDIRLFKLLSKRNQHGVPLYALLLQLAIIIFLIISSSFETVITYLGFTLTLSSCITVLGVFIHRMRYPNAHRPYRTWGYPLTPLIFLAIGIWMLVFIFRDKPAESLAGLGTILLGIPVYLWGARHKETPIRGMSQPESLSASSSTRFINMIESHSRLLLLAMLGLGLSFARCTPSPRQDTAVTSQPTQSVQQVSPVASPVASPAASPAASPVASPVESQTSAKPNPTTQFDPATSRQLTDTAKFLAGMELEANSNLANLAQSSAWVEYHNTLENAWQKLEAQQLSPIKDWSGTELRFLSQTNKSIFYPFGGPDFLYAHTFFPNAHDYVLIGLEPVGKLPDLTALSEGEIAQKLQEMNGAMYSLLQFSFFQTKSMRVDLADKGVLPILFLFLARTHNQILSLDYVGLDKDGNINVYPDGNIDNAYFKGVKISFTQAGKPEPQYLYYFSLDLSNTGFQSSPALKNFADKLLKAPITYTKAASYLMHDNSFSQIRDFVLARSSAVLEDDSGLPIRYFDPNQWKLQLYGTYTRPIALFNEEYQSDLAKMYSTDPNVRSLNFGIGYKYRADESNLMLAVKKN